jgi:hypothetical protein
MAILHPLTWIKSPSDSTLRRGSIAYGSWDCAAGRCDACAVGRRGDHGKCGDSWQFIVGHARGALVLQVSTPFAEGFPEQEARDVAWTRREILPIYKGWRRLLADGSDLSLHTAFTTASEAIRHGTPGAPCAFIDGVCFCPFSTGIGAQELFEAHGADSYVQPETFWRALEEKFCTLYANAEALRADTRCDRCPTCNGSGLVDRFGRPFKAGG